MKLCRFSVPIAIAIPATGFAQLSIFDAAYQLDAIARSGSSTDSHSSSSNGTGPVQSYFDITNAFASSPPSTVHSWASTTWNCTPTDLDAGLEACWDSFDFGAGNSGHMFAQLFLGINLSTLSIVSTAAAYDPSNSTAAIDMWVNNSWTQIVSPTQITNYQAIWQPGDYRLRAQRLYNPVGNSTGCVPLSFHMHAEPLPEPASLLALGSGAVLILRRRKAKAA